MIVHTQCTTGIRHDMQANKSQTVFMDMERTLLIHVLCTLYSDEVQKPESTLRIFSSYQKTMDIPVLEIL